MINISYIRKNPELVKERLKLKNFKELNLIDEVFELDKEKRVIQADFDSKQSIINNTSFEIGKLKAKGINVENEKDYLIELRTKNLPKFDSSINIVKFLKRATILNKIIS